MSSSTNGGGTGDSKWFDSPYVTQSGKQGNFKRCFEENHKPLKIGGGTFLGGNCGRPIVKNYDVYVGLDDFSYKPQKTSGYPWAEVQEETGPDWDFVFNIQDMSVPTKGKLADFKKLVSWIVEMLDAGKKVHVGCIGGHGRTGLVLAAVIAELGHLQGEEGNKVIQWVRKNYCSRAVESATQVKFLMTHYGVAEATASKTTTSTGKYSTKGYKAGNAGGHTPSSKAGKGKGSSTVVEPLESDMCIFNLTNATQQSRV